MSETQFEQSVKQLQAKGITVTPTEFGSGKYKVIINENTKVVSKAEIVQLAESYTTLYS